MVKTQTEIKTKQEIEAIPGTKAQTPCSREETNLAHQSNEITSDELHRHSDPTQEANREKTGNSTAIATTSVTTTSRDSAQPRTGPTQGANDAMGSFSTGEIPTPGTATTKEFHDPLCAAPNLEIVERTNILAWMTNAAMNRIIAILDSTEMRAPIRGGREIKAETQD